MTIKELKTITLQKVFAISDGRVVNDDTTQEYLTAMMGAANEGLQLLATAGRFLKKRTVILQNMEGTPEEDGFVTVCAPGSGICRYDLAELVEDFYSLDMDGVYVEDSQGYHRANDWSMEAGHVFLLPSTAAGKWTIYYNAYPPELTSETPDDYILPLYPEVAALLPLYIASQIYKDDDIAMATQYRNEFEVGREELKAAAQRGSVAQDKWTSVTGWW